MKHARNDYNERIQDSANLIPEDEPVFLLRGQDVCAPSVVRRWITEARARGASHTILNAAGEQAQRMVEWQLRHGTKVPDMPPTAVVKDEEPKGKGEEA